MAGTVQINSQWREAADIDPRLLEWRASRGWWDLIAELGVTLLITREYEHLVMAASAPGGRPRLSFFPLPHPSGLTVDRKTRRVHVASTRNPNQVFTFRPTNGHLERMDVKANDQPGSPLVAVATTTYPGCLYIHDLAMIGGKLFANAVGHNAVVGLSAEGCFERIWWPRCVEKDGEPVFGRNHIQLNSIAAGRIDCRLFFLGIFDGDRQTAARALKLPGEGPRRDFLGRTRDPICTGLTRPHSARLRGGKTRQLWVANSGYGELGYVNQGKLEVVARLPGWTRGLCITGTVAFVATSRVIPKYNRYAPGLDASTSRCAVHAVSLTDGKVLGSLDWPQGNQVFAVDWISSSDTAGFFWRAGARKQRQASELFYSYRTDTQDRSG